MSAAKRKSREQDLEPTERDVGGNADAGDGGAGEAGVPAASKGKGGGGKKRQRGAAAAEGGNRGEDLDRLKKGFLGGGQTGGRRAGSGDAARGTAAAEDFVQPKKKKAIKGPC